MLDVQVTQLVVQGGDAIASFEYRYNRYDQVKPATSVSQQFIIKHIYKANRVFESAVKLLVQLAKHFKLTGARQVIDDDYRAIEGHKPLSQFIHVMAFLRLLWSFRLVDCAVAKPSQAIEQQPDKPGCHGKQRQFSQ